MDNKALLKEIAKHATILDYHIKRLKKKPEQLHKIDVEVMSEKIKEIYTLVHSLETGELKIKEAVVVVNEVEKVPMVKVEPEPEMPAPEAPRVSSELEVQSAELPETSDQPPVTSRQEPVANNDPPIPEPRPASREPVASSEQPIPVPRPPSPVPEVSSEFEVGSAELPETSIEEPKTTADLFSGPTTIADSFQAKGDNSIAATVSPHAVQDLKMAIGINDKFLFINELFKGDPSVYNDAIDKLNTVGEIQAADHAIEAYRNEFSWADNSEAYHRLKKIVRLKYNA